MDITKGISRVAKRTAQQWSALKPDYRERLERSGITKADYMGGANLQAGRGQAIERERAEERIENPDLAGASTIRAWKGRALSLGVTRDDWQSAYDATGREDFDQVREAIAAKERANRAWKAAGSPSLKQRRERRAQGLPDGSFSEFIGDEPMEWGDSWGYYH